MVYTVPLQLSGRWWPLEDLSVKRRHFSREKDLRHLLKSIFNPNQGLGLLQYLFFFWIKSDEASDRALQGKELPEKLSVRVNAF